MGYSYKGADIPYAKYSREGNAANWATDAYTRLKGRAPTADELAAALPSYLGTDKNITDVGAGDAFIAGQKNIQDLGKSQYDQSLKGIEDVTTADTQRVKDLMAQSLPDIAENAQSAHLYDSTGYGQEVARQQAQLASGAAGNEANLKLGALGSLQQMEQSGLQRQFSLQDYSAQANLAQMLAKSQQPASGKGGGMGALGGAASGATAGAAFGPWGAGIGAVGGGLAGGLSKRPGGK